MPHFMACPSTITLIAATILFLTGIIRLNYHNRDDVLLPHFIMRTFAPILELIEWKRFFASLQTSAPIIIWSYSTISALFHPIFRWAFPDYYAALVRANVIWTLVVSYFLIDLAIRLLVVWYVMDVLYIKRGIL